MKNKPQVILDLERKLNKKNIIHRLDEDGEIISLNLNKILFTDLSIIDYEIENLSQLKFLSLRNNAIEFIDGLFKLTNLESLDLSDNQIENINGLSTLINLKNLDLSNNKISNILTLSNLINLKDLDLSNNKIEYIPPKLFEKTRIQNLNLERNQLKNIEFIKPLKNLKSLDISANQINNIDEIISIRDPKFLDFTYNNISNLSICVLKNSKFKNLSYEKNLSYSALNLFGNPLDESLLKKIGELNGEIFDDLKIADRILLLKYLESNEKGTIKIEEAKMVLLGEPRAGKTTLQKYLMGLEVVENEPSTPDIQISAWKPFVKDISREDRKNIKINLWDFGGQEIQYSLHKLFMTTDTLYIIVLDSTKDQSPQKYLEFLENYAPNAPFIIINNYGDAPTSNTFKIDENYLRETYNGRNEKLPVLKKIFHRVSVLKAAKNDPSWRKIMNEVEETIKTELLQLENLNKEFPTEYLNVKQAVEAEYTKPDKHYITMSYYRERCRELQITDEEDLRIAILLYLNQIGVLRYFKDSPITDRHILNPKWLIDGAYSLIIDEETQLNQGVLGKDQALRILKKSNKFKFFDDEAVFIFKTMNFYGLLHYEEKEDKIYIPIRFGSNQPIALHEFYEQGQHFVFEFKGDIPEDVMPTLIVRHFSEVRNRHYWSKGAVFTNGEVRILAKHEDRSIHFYIIGKYHQTYFGILRNALIKTLNLLPGLLYDEMVDFEFEGKKIRAKYEDLIIVLNENWGDYRNYATKTKIDVNQIIQILGGYFSIRQIEQITNVTNNNFYGDFNDNRYQQITIIQELNSLVQVVQNADDRKALVEINSEIKILNETKEVKKKESLGKNLLSKIKQLSTDSFDDVVKDKLKELFPKIVEKGIDWIEKVDLDGIMQIFGGI